MIWFQRVLQKLQYLFLGIVMGLNFFILGSNFKLYYLFSGGTAGGYLALPGSGHNS